MLLSRQYLHPLVAKVLGGWDAVEGATCPWGLELVWSYFSISLNGYMLVLGKCPHSWFIFIQMQSFFPSL